MKVLFLDIDGVTKPFNRPACPKAIAQVERIIQVTGCSVVLSSTWRLGAPGWGFTTPAETKVEAGSIPWHCWASVFLAEAGFTPLILGHLINATPDLSRMLLDEDGEGLGLFTQPRAEEIHAWLTLNPKVTHWVCLDDQPDWVRDIAEDHKVLTNPLVGLTQQEADRAIKILT